MQDLGFHATDVVALMFTQEDGSRAAVYVQENLQSQRSTLVAVWTRQDSGAWVQLVVFQDTPVCAVHPSWSDCTTWQANQVSRAVSCFRPRFLRCTLLLSKVNLLNLCKHNKHFLNLIKTGCVSGFLLQYVLCWYSHFSDYSSGIHCKDRTAQASTTKFGSRPVVRCAREENITRTRHSFPFGSLDLLFSSNN